MGKTNMNGTHIQSSGKVTSGTVAVQQQVGQNITVEGHVSGYNYEGKTRATGFGIGFGFSHNF